MKFTYLTCAILLMAGTVEAQQDGSVTSAYAFGTSCASQGSWTQSALQATQTLRRITLQLKDDANCKALGTNTQIALQEIETQLKNVSDSPKRVSRLAQIPSEVEALRIFAQSNPAMQNQVMKLMMSRSIEGATLSAQVGAPNSSDPAAITNGLQDFGNRIQRSTKTGVTVLNKVIDTLPQMDQCLAGGDQQALGNFIASSIQVATAFAGSGQDSTGSQMATLVSKLTNVLRERKYTKGLRTLNQQEFMASMSCLMEVTSESYCQARDAMGLFRSGMSDLNWRQESGKKVDSKNPFLGYYVLNTHIPNITRWMQKIQIGVDPKLPTDATFQNKIQQEVTDFYKSLKVLLGTYNSSLLTIRSLPSLEQKQSEVLKLVMAITESMQNGGGFNSDGAGAKTNFFTMNKMPMKIPFYLIGMDEVPDQVQGRAQGLQQINAFDWLQAHMNELPQFKDPVTLAETVGRNMQSLGHDANISVISYFSKWYIVDKQALVSEAVTDVNYTVKDSLRVVSSYLDVVKARVSATGDETVVSTMMDTQKRIQNVLAAFDKVEATGKAFAAKSSAANLIKEDIDTAAAASEELVNTVVEQFVVMQARSGFLANRLVNDVYQDYMQLLKSNESFSEKQKEIFIQAGMAALDRMLQMYNGNPSNIQSDLNMALRINKGNLKALESVLKDNVIGTIYQLKMASDGNQISTNPTFRLLKDSFNYKIPTVHALMTSPFTLFKQYITHSDRYSSGATGTTKNSEFDDAKFLQSQLCVQALAFDDQSGIESLCMGTVLKTPYPNVTGYDISYGERLNSHLKDKDAEPKVRQARNHSDRICAFRDYNRRNMVLFMSLNKK